MLHIKQAGDCPYLSVVLWEMVLSRKHSRHMLFPDALPFGCSRASFFRRGWHRADLHKAGWLSFGIRITPRFRDLLVNWYERQESERAKPQHDSSDGLTFEPPVPAAEPQQPIR
jgi:hypothetical protein